MKKWEIGLLVFFIVVSTIYSFTLPVQTTQTETDEIEYVIYVEGLLETSITFDYVPTLQELFDALEIENEYGFDVTRQLENQQVIYIPISQGISLNNASMEELMELSGVGEVTATKIIEYREATPFGIIEDIQNVSGIGEKTYLNLREYLWP
ncbi:helix-hairpin-helix domain-containing protein [Tannockella kyphosi]|uniref:helix-hairpin-helix domain-containing protein n=1 Tax=Tannockella kyphosi TaxID=2899121 RepID=UPI002011B6F9|nr:helix-hairpin-helix domain-containing protein [Tannockella kyphosi]